MASVEFKNVQAIVTDIEGTTTAISFVFETLFPFARQHLPGYVRQNADKPEVQEQLKAVAEAVNQNLDTEGAIKTLVQWIDEDRKVTPLKTLQGMIWAEGYASGELKGHIYADAEACLRQWHSDGKDLYIYSSGSIQAQKLIFGHTDYGDLTPLFKGYFDTTTGPKREAGSYRQIAEAVGKPPENILFLSDVKAELDAAHETGMKTCWLVRDEMLSAEAAHPQVRSFVDINTGKLGD